MNSLEPSFSGFALARTSPHAGAITSTYSERRVLRSNYRPLSAVPSRAAKHAGESKRGRHNQSIEPSRHTNVAVLVADQRIIFDGITIALPSHATNACPRSQPYRVHLLIVACRSAIRADSVHRGHFY
jgi:hypothetical protein